MKKRFIGIIGLTSIMACALASCGNNTNSTLIEKEDDTTTLTNSASISSSVSSNSQSKDLKYDPVYVSTTIDTLNTISEASETTAVEDAVELIYDSVVSVTATSTSAISSGSAVFFAEDNTLGFSYLVTCFHVIEDAYSFYITDSDGDSYEAYLVGGYEDEDLAVLAIKTPNDEEITYANFFLDSDTLKLGSTVICIGNPLGTLPGSVSKGVVSYNNRKITVDTYKTQSLIQTDVAINSGNSGGGLFNTAGALIGIVSAKYSSSSIEGLGFAIPSNTVRDAVLKLLSTAKYDTANEVWYQGYYEGDYEYGFTISIGTYQSGYGYNATRQIVAYISDVESNSSYTGTSLNENDIIKSISIDYKDENKTDSNLYSFSSLTDIMDYLYYSDINIGDTISFVVTRSNKEIEVTFEVEQFRYAI